MSNADQFKLPEELDPKEKLPFSWKWSEERQDDFDQNPKNCSGCRKTSRGMPSVGCDFCSNVYHLDCLDPPLCEIPRVSAKRDPKLRAYSFSYFDISKSRTCSVQFPNSKFDGSI